MLQGVAVKDLNHNHRHEQQEIAMLRGELEMLMVERDRLLRTAGAAAMFIAKLDTRTIPQNSYLEADVLAATINALPEETLVDALDHAHEVADTAAN